jgi:hypothetical protein
MKYPQLSSVPRRQFLGGLTITVGGSLIAGLVPTSLLQAASLTQVCLPQDPCGDWQVDDMCLAYPPYAFRIDSGVPQTQPLTLNIAPADRHWIME